MKAESRIFVAMVNEVWLCRRIRTKLFRGKSFFEWLTKRPVEKRTATHL